MGVVVCWCPSSANISLMVSPSFAFMKGAPNSASADDDVTNFKSVQRVKCSPLSVMGYPYLGTEPRKKFPDARLLEFFADRQDMSEWVFNTMSDELNLIIASMFVAR